jgi:hypothetical protein
MAEDSPAGRILAASSARAPVRLRRFVPDSSLEGTRFELLVPPWRGISAIFVLDAHLA